MSLVFIHGSGGTGHVWKYQMSHFSDALAVTLPGHPDGEPCANMSEAAAWVREHCHDRVSGDLILVGHSLGGGIALQYALDYPEELKAMVLVGSGARLRVHPDTLQQLSEMVADDSGYEATFAESWLKVPPEFRAELKANALTMGPAAPLNDMRICDAFDVIGRLGEIRTPTLAIVGTEDIMTPPKYSEFLRDRIDGAEMVVIDGGTHFVFGEYPDKVNAAIETFVAAH